MRLTLLLSHTPSCPKQHNANAGNCLTEKYLYYTYFSEYASCHQTQEKGTRHTALLLATTELNFR